MTKLLPRTVLVLGALLWGCSGGGGSDEGSTRAASGGAPPVPVVLSGNVVLVVLDDISPDFVEAYGEAPGALLIPGVQDTLSAIAANGVRFDNVWTNPRCVPSRASLMTGTTSQYHGFGGNADDRFVETRGANLVRTLERSGVEAHMLGKWHLALEDNVPGATSAYPTHALDFGWRSWRGTLGNIRAIFDWNEMEEWPLYVNGSGPSRETRYATSYLVDEALQLLPSLAEPWFLYLPVHSVHEPLDVPPNGLLEPPGASKCVMSQERYECSIEALDQELGRLRAALDLSDTTLVVLGDNGSVSALLSGLGTGWPLQRGKSTVYTGGTRVPLLVEGRGVAASQRGAASEAFVMVQDLFSTILELTGVQDPERHGSVALQPYLRDASAASQRDHLYAERYPGDGGPDWSAPDSERAARTGDWLLISDLDGSDELYDLAGDPRQQSPILVPTTAAQQAAWNDLQAYIAGQERRLVSWTDCQGSAVAGLGAGDEACWSASQSNLEPSAPLDVSGCTLVDVENERDADGDGVASTASYFVDDCPSAAAASDPDVRVGNAACRAIPGLAAATRSQDDPLAPGAGVTGVSGLSWLRAVGANDGARLAEGRVEVNCR